MLIIKFLAKLFKRKERKCNYQYQEGKGISLQILQTKKNKK